MGVKISASKAKKTQQADLVQMLRDAEAKVTKAPFGAKGLDSKGKKLARKRTVDLDVGSPDADVAPKRAPRSAANVVPIKPAATLNRPPKPALAFKPARPGTKRALMAEAVLRPEGATLDALMNLTGWDRNTTSGAIIWDLCSQMGMGVRRDGDRYYGSLPEGVTSAVREPAPVRMAANKAAASRK